MTHSVLHEPCEPKNRDQNLGVIKRSTYRLPDRSFGSINSEPWGALVPDVGEGWAESIHPD